MKAEFIFARMAELAGKYPLDFITHGFLFVPVLVFAFQYRHLTKPLRLVGWYFTFEFLLECVLLGYSIFKQNSLFLHNLNATLQIVLIGTIFACVLGSDSRKVLVGITVSLAFLSVFFFKKDEFSSATITVFRIYCIGIVLFYFWMILSKMEIRNIFLHSFFWFCSGLIIYSSGTLFLFLFSEVLFKATTEEDVFRFSWNVNQVFYILFCVLSSLALWVSKFETIDNRFSA